MKTKIIVLESNEHSATMGQKCISRAKEFGISPEIFSAVDGRDAPAILEELGLRQYKFKMKGGRLGVLGCFLSHYFLWCECVEADEPFMILEHDAYMLRPLPEDIMDRFTDILKLDYLNPYSKMYNNHIVQQQDIEEEIWSLHDREDHGKFVHSQGLYSMGGYGYIVKPHAALHLVGETKMHGYRPADHMLYTTEFTDIQHIKPSIVRIHPEYIEQNAMKTLSLTRNLEQHIQHIDNENTDTK
jgi:GR25 family glycosyltransferase involved in LPS biosynthesis